MIQKMNKIELYCLFCTCVEPLVRGYAASKPLVYLCRTCLTVSGVRMTCLGALISKAGLVCGCQSSLMFFRIQGTFEVSL